jgi:hypothetical protein
LEFQDLADILGIADILDRVCLAHQDTLDTVDILANQVRDILDTVDIQVNQDFLVNQDLADIQAAVYLDTVDIQDQVHQDIQVTLAKLVHRVFQDIQA